MNSRVAKFLSKVARSRWIVSDKSVSRDTIYTGLKCRWKGTPRNERGKLRKSLQKEIT